MRALLLLTNVIATVAVLHGHAWPELHRWPEVAVNAKVDPAAKPVVILYSAKWCRPCDKPKADEAAKLFPFRFEIWDVDTKEAPDTVTTIPAFRWVGKDGRDYIFPPEDYPQHRRVYPGANELIRIWMNTQK